VKLLLRYTSLGQQLIILSVRISLPTCQKSLVIKQVTVKWVKGLEFGVAFEHLDEREVERRRRMLDDLLGSGSYSGLPRRRHAFFP